MSIMKNNIKYIFFILLGVLLAACTKVDNTLNDGEGYLRFGFTQENDILVTRSEQDVIFSVQVIDLKSGVIVKEVNDHHELLDKPLKLKAGEYKVIAINGSDVDAAFDAPFYVGEKTINVQSGTTNHVNIVCTLSNVKVSVIIDQSILDNFTKYIITVDNGDKGTLVYDEALSTLNSFGYFKCTGKLNWKIDLVNNNGKEFSLDNKIFNVKPREHYRLNFSVNENGDKDAGSISLDITIDNSTNDVDHNVDIPLDKEAAPTISGKDFNIDENLQVNLGADALGEILVNSDAGVSGISIKHSNQSLVDMGIPMDFEINGLDESTKSQINAAGIIWGDFSEGINSIALDFKTAISKLPLGSYTFNITVNDVQSQYVNKDFTVIVLPDEEVQANSVDAWAKFAFLYAKWNTVSQPEALVLKYRAVSASEWEIVSAENLTIEDNKVSYKLMGLIPESEYEFCLATVKGESNIIQFTTEAASQLPNMNFDAWTKSGKEWYPNSDLDAGFIWDTANKGANTLSERNPTRPEETDVAVAGPGKKAAKMVSSDVVGIMAAGNVYAGQFIQRSGTSAIIDWGRPFTSRPSSLKGYFKYSPKTIDKAKDPYMHMKGKMDECQIFVALMDWNIPYRINSGQANYINFATDPNVIAYGQMSTNETINEYREFNFDIEYRDSRTPKYVVLVCVASKYGDYFTGGIGSTLFVDELEFEY